MGILMSLKSFVYYVFYTACDIYQNTVYTLAPTIPYAQNLFCKAREFD